MDLVTYLDHQMATWTRGSYVTSLRLWGEWLVKTGRRPDDPAGMIPRPRCPRGVPRPIAAEHVPVILAEPSDPRTRMMLALAAYAGLRVHEIARCRGEDVTPDSLYVVGKGGQSAMLPTHPVVWESTRPLPREGWLFPSPAGGCLRPRTVGRMMTYAMRSAGVAGSPHQLRHYFGTATLRSSGGNLRVVQELLRHANPATTAIYTRVEDAEKRDAVLALA